jgi:hypothetical protein
MGGVEVVAWAKAEETIPAPIVKSIDRFVFILSPCDFSLWGNLLIKAMDWIRHLMLWSIPPRATKNLNSPLVGLFLFSVKIKEKQNLSDSSYTGIPSSCIYILISIILIFKEVELWLQ